MKVYIVTSGEYSDYHIERVFLDKKQAEKYVELSKDSWDEKYVEEFETDDDKDIKPIKYVEVNYLKKKRYSSDKLGLELKIRTTNTLDNTKENLNHTYLWDKGDQLNIQRVLKDNYDESKLYLKYEKVCQDIMSKIESLMQIEGWSESMIQEWLGQNADQYINK